MEYHGLRTDLINTTANTVTVIWLHGKRFEGQPHSVVNAFDKLKESTSSNTTLCTELTTARDLFSVHCKRCNCYFHTELFGTIWHFKRKESARAVSFISYQRKNIMISRNCPLVRSISKQTQQFIIFPYNIFDQVFDRTKIKHPILSAYYLFHLKSQVREKHFTLKTDKILERTKEVLLIISQHIKFIAKLTTLYSFILYTEHKR